MVAEVVRTLRERGARFEVVQHAPAAAAREEAIALGSAPEDVLKAVLLETRQGHALAVLPASHRLDMGLVREVTGDPHTRLATESEIVRELPNCELGAVPPLGSLLHAAVYVDPEVLRHPVVAFAAGSRTASVTGAPEELFRGEMVTIASIGHRQLPEPRGV